jgi:hypothetical protein
MEIDRSIVQGSGIGPFLYILMESYLHPHSQNNEIFNALTMQSLRPATRRLLLFWN